MEPNFSIEHTDREIPSSRESGVSSIARTLTEEKRPRHLASLERALRRFTPGERAALYLFATLLCLATLAMLWQLNTDASVVVPTAGGALIEGETGPARFINPLLSISQPDQDLAALVYSGLMRALPDGSVVPDLAASYSVSPDGRTYTFKIRQSAVFSDGTPVTAADVLFTVQEAQDPQLNSARRADWTGVLVGSPDPETVVFTLPHAYAPFIQNATLGILPKHLWQSVPSEEFPFSTLNTHPVGSGPYKIANVATDSTGAASRYDLVPSGGYALGAPYLSRISFVFYPDQDALVRGLESGEINAASGLAASDVAGVARSDLAALEVPLPRVFGVFYNQSHNAVLADPSVRQALEAATDKQAIIAQSLGGLGMVLDSPIPPGTLGTAEAALARPLESIGASAKAPQTASLAEAARSILQSGGWTFNPSSGVWTKGKQTLSFVLTTADQPELVSTARALAAAWQAAGMQVSVQIYPLAQLNTNVIRPRSYDALLFGEVVGPQLDLYAFWHSSQRNDPGLNLAMYANSNADAILSQARATTDPAARGALYQQFASALVKDRPALFLYAPDFIYVVPKSLQGISLGALSGPSGRFASAYRWYMQTEYVWSVFATAARAQ